MHYWLLRVRITGLHGFLDCWHLQAQGSAQEGGEAWAYGGSKGHGLMDQEDSVFKLTILVSYSFSQLDIQFVIPPIFFVRHVSRVIKYGTESECCGCEWIVPRPFFGSL